MCCGPLYNAEERARVCATAKKTAFYASVVFPSRDSLVHNVAHVSRTEDTVGRKGGIDAEPDMLPGIPGSVVYVQNPDDSRNSAIRIAYRNSLRPSS